MDDTATCSLLTELLDREVRRNTELEIKVQDMERTLKDKENQLMFISKSHLKQADLIKILERTNKELLGKIPKVDNTK